MVRPTIDLESHKEEVADLYINERRTWPQIAEYLGEQGVTISAERLRKRAMEEWGLKKRTDPAVSREAAGRARVLFHDQHMDDKSMLRVLRHEGYRISKRSLRCLRSREGMHRNKSASGAITDDELRPIIANALETGGIKGYGRTMLHSHFREMGLMVSR